MLTFETHITACASDIYGAVASGKYTLDMQVRAYDLLDMILAMEENGMTIPRTEAVVNFCAAYDEHKDRLESMICETVLEAEAEDVVKPYEMALEEARTDAAAAEELHVLAKETFRIWQSAGLLARWRALGKLRKRAGFRLESHRIGNYVAKTYDLMEEARRAHQKAQQALFSANVAYKCQEGILSRIYSVLK